MLRDKEIIILNLLRNDGRISFRQMNRVSNIPTTTIFDYCRNFRNKSIVKSFRTIVDFCRLGLKERVAIIETEDQKLIRFLKSADFINSFLELNGSCFVVDYLVGKNIPSFEDILDDFDCFLMFDKEVVEVFSKETAKLPLKSG